MLCTMCSPGGVSVDKVCPTCQSCIHICRGANGNPCRPNIPLPEELPVTTIVDLPPPTRKKP